MFKDMSQFTATVSKGKTDVNIDTLGFSKIAVEIKIATKPDDGDARL